jgi:hypothetical protein
MKVIGRVFAQSAGGSAIRRGAPTRADDTRDVSHGMNRNGLTSWQRKFDWQPQPILWQFEASENVCQRVIIIINEPEFHSFAGQDSRLSMMRFRDGALWQLVGRWQRGEVL